MENKFTNGDWFASGLEVVSMPSQIKISNSISGENYEAAKANAKLISAAKDLFLALSEIMDFPDDFFIREADGVETISIRNESILKAKAALQKATA